MHSVRLSIKGHVASGDGLPPSQNTIIKGGDHSCLRCNFNMWSTQWHHVHSCFTKVRISRGTVSYLHAQQVCPREQWPTAADCLEGNFMKLFFVRMASFLSSIWAYPKYPYTKDIERDSVLDFCCITGVFFRDLPQVRWNENIDYQCNKTDHTFFWNFN